MILRAYYMLLFFCLVILAAFNIPALASDTTSQIKTEEKTSRPPNSPPASVPWLTKSALTDGIHSDMEPEFFLNQTYNGIKGGVFKGLVSHSYTLMGIDAFYGCDDDILRQHIAYTYPDFYEPTWREFFDHMAKQMKAKWTWKEENKNFEFCGTNEKSFFSVDLEPNWRMQDRGLYIWHAPEGQNFGMDIYYFGHFSAPENKDKNEFYNRVRDHFAIDYHKVMGSVEIPSLNDMQIKKIISGDEALYWYKKDFSRLASKVVWRQWAFTVEGHMFLIISAMPEENEIDTSTAVDRMISTFSINQ